MGRGGTPTATDEGDAMADDEGPRAALRPRWLWIAFGVIAVAIPLVGLWLERHR